MMDKGNESGGMLEPKFNETGPLLNQLINK